MQALQSQHLLNLNRNQLDFEWPKNKKHILITIIFKKHTSSSTAETKLSSLRTERVLALGVCVLYHKVLATKTCNICE